jgi:hypothetical protein
MSSVGSSCLDLAQAQNTKDTENPCVTVSLWLILSVSTAASPVEPTSEGKTGSYFASFRLRQGYGGPP